MPAMRQTRRSGPKKRTSLPARHRQPSRRATGQHDWGMKLGAWAHARMREAQNDKRTRGILAGATLVSVAAVLVLLAAGLGVLDEMGNSVSRTAAETARTMGLSVRVVTVQAPLGTMMSEHQRAEAEAIAGVIPDEVMFSVDPEVVRSRVADLPWVEGVTVRRLWPDQIQIVVIPRAATALWQENGKLSFMDARGGKLGAAPLETAHALPLVVGPKAGEAAPDLFAALAPNRAVAERLLAAVRINGRRWNLRLKSGSDVLLPEHDYAQAIAMLEQLQASHRLLDRSFASVDLRQAGNLILRPSAEVRSASSVPHAAKSARGV
jgi:cell division protein FtsQ